MLSWTVGAGGGPGTRKFTLAGTVMFGQLIVGGVVSGMATANTVPFNSVICGVLVLSNTTWNRPPETVPSRLSCGFLMGAAPPLLNTLSHWLPLKNFSTSAASAPP